MKQTYTVTGMTCHSPSMGHRRGPICGYHISPGASELPLGSAPKGARADARMAEQVTPCREVPC